MHIFHVLVQCSKMSLQVPMNKQNKFNSLLHYTTNGENQYELFAGISFVFDNESMRLLLLFSLLLPTTSD